MDMTQPQTRKPPGKIRAAIIQLFGGAPLQNETFREALVTTSASTSGQTVNEQAMLSLSAVWACARLVSETIATLPLHVYEKTPEGRRRAPNHPLDPIISQRPNSDTTAAVHWEATVAAMMLRGNGRAEKLFLGDRLVGLRFLHPARLSVTYKTDGTPVYSYYEADGKRREIPTSRIFNIPGFSLDGVSGVSVIAHGANVFGTAMAADSVAGKTFANGLMPTTFFKYPQILRDNQREEARAAIKQISGSLNAGNPAILEAGMETGNIGINPSDAQLLESRAFSVEEICRWFRVPPFMVGHSEKSTSWGSGIEQQMIGFLIFTLRPWLTRIEQAITKDLLSPADQTRYYIEFSVEGLLRGDSQARSSFYSTALQNGWMNRNQVAALENMPPIPGGDIYTVQSNLVPLDQLGRASPGSA
jgi:HK97 family phage portal protein